VRLWLTAVLLSILILAGLNSGHSGIRQSGVFSGDLATPYTHYFPQGSQRGRVLVIHGLNGNKEMMNPLSLALSDAWIRRVCHRPPRTWDSRVGFNAMLARHTVNSALEILGPDTIAIGHSLGGAALLDLAGSRSFETLVLLSPAPTPVEMIHAERLLVLTGQFDLPRIRAFVPQLETSGSEGVVLRTIPWSGHSGYLLHPQAIRGIVSWLGGDPAQCELRAFSVSF
jgi:pimeloyl-ACP methyl ester carboxylesterase